MPPSVTGRAEDPRRLCGRPYRGRLCYRKRTERAIENEEGGVPEDGERFQRRARAWLEENAPRYGWVSEERGRRRDEDEKETLRRAKECQALLFDNGFAGLSWPTEYGGQGLGIREQIAFNVASLDYDLPLGPYIIGPGMCGPTILAVARRSRSSATSGRCCGARRCGVSSSPNPAPAPTSRGSLPAPCPTVTSGS
jgi:hypothetical protein